MEMLKRRVHRYNVRNTIQGINWNQLESMLSRTPQTEIGWNWCERLAPFALPHHRKTPPGAVWNGRHQSDAQHSNDGQWTSKKATSLTEKFARAQAPHLKLVLEPIRSTPDLSLRCKFEYTRSRKKTSALPRKRFNAFRKARNKKIQKESEFQIFQRTKNRVVIVTAFVQIGQGRGRPWRLPVKAINRSKRSSTVRAQVALAFTALKGPARSPNCQRFLPLLWNLVPVHSNHTSTVLV